MTAMTIKTGCIALAIVAIALSFAAEVRADTVSGTIQYENKTYDSSGFTGTEYLPVRRADIEVIRDSDGVVLGSGETNAVNGTYSINIANGGSINIYLRVYARQDNAAVNIIVKNNQSDEQIYTATTSTATYDTNAPIANLDLNMSISGGAAPAFNIFDVSVFNYEFLSTIVAPFPSPLPQLKIYWQSGSTNGTYYSRAANAVFLLGKSTDTDEYDDDIILHEIGHFMAGNFSKDDSPGGYHTITGQYDIRLTWSEGWAHYWSCAVRNYAGAGRYPSASTIVDTFSGGASAFDIEAPSLSSQTIMASNEVAVAAILWDISDNTPGEGGIDNLAKGDDEIWTVIDNEIPVRSQISLEDFFIGWQNQVVPADVAATVTIMNGRSVKYAADARESNNTPATATAITPSSPLASNTIYPAGDQDWFSFSVAAGDKARIETKNLGDGCDTYLEIYDTNGTTVIAVNDDRALGDTSSLLQYEFASAGTYYARVTAYAGSDQIVEFGYYDIEMTLVPNSAPTISTVAASSSSGTIPFTVNFAVSASDSDGSIALYEWDFDGDGVYDYSSMSSGNVSYTYTVGGSYTATVRVTDNKGASSTGTSAITASYADAAPSLDAVIGSISGSNAPVTVSFSCTNLSNATLFQWDFESDGIIDFTAISSANASFTYTAPGSYRAKVFVTVGGSTTYSAQTSQIVVNAGSNPPTISSFTASTQSGSIPFNVIFTVVSTDNGAVTTYEWDFDGDGRYDRKTGSAQSVISYTYTSVGVFTPVVRVVDDSNLTATSDLSAAITATMLSVGGWIVDPATTDTISGDSITVTAEVVPAGVSKSVQFQYRTNAPQGTWIDIGSPVVSSSTIVQTSWDIGGFAEGSTFDLQAVIDGSTATSAVVVMILSSSPQLSQYQNSGGETVVERVIDRNRASRVFFNDGTILRFPYGSLSASSNPTVRLTKRTSLSADANGAAEGLASTGAGYDISFSSGSPTIVNSYTITLHYSDTDDNEYVDGSNINAKSLNTYWYNTSTGRWTRDLSSTVDRSSKIVETSASHMTEFAIFGESAVEGGGGGGGAGPCYLSAPQAGRSAALLLAAALIAAFVAVAIAIFRRRTYE